MVLFEGVPKISLRTVFSLAISAYPDEMPLFHCLPKYLLLKGLKNRLSKTHAIL